MYSMQEAMKQNSLVCRNGNCLEWTICERGLAISSPMAHPFILSVRQQLPWSWESHVPSPSVSPGEGLQA